jgi:hypothetical protein
MNVLFGSHIVRYFTIPNLPVKIMLILNHPEQHDSTDADELAII